mgnify:CR=1 FL=1
MSPIQHCKAFNVVVLDFLFLLLLPQGLTFSWFPVKCK